MKKKIFKRGMAGLLAVLTAFTTLIGMGTTAFAASETAESYMVSYPRDGDAVQVYDQSTWGHSAKTYMNGWSTQSSNVTTIHCMDSYDGNLYGIRFRPCEGIYQTEGQLWQRQDHQDFRRRQGGWYQIHCCR